MSLAEDRTCKMTGCTKRLIARQLCKAHYQSEKKAGRLDTHAIVVLPATPDCQWCGAELPLPVPGAYRRHCDAICTQRETKHRPRCGSWPDCNHDRPRHGKARKPLLERLLKQIDQTGGPDACWLWTGAINERGYGQTFMWVGERQVTLSASRAMYIATHGPVVDDLFVLHECDNPPCCNPRHLRPGTQIENMADRIEHGAGYGRGNDSPVAIQIEDHVVQAIKDAYRPYSRDAGQPALARQFGLSRTTVQRIVTESDRWAEPA